MPAVPSFVLPVHLPASALITSSHASIETDGFLFFAIIMALIPLVIRLFVDLDARRQGWLDRRDELRRREREGRQRLKSMQ